MGQVNETLRRIVELAGALRIEVGDPFARDWSSHLAVRKKIGQEGLGERPDASPEDPTAVFVKRLPTILGGGEITADDRRFYMEAIADTRATLGATSTGVASEIKAQELERLNRLPQATVDAAVRAFARTFAEAHNLSSPASQLSSGK